MTKVIAWRILYARRWFKYCFTSIVWNLENEDDLSNLDTSEYIWDTVS